MGVNRESESRECVSAVGAAHDQAVRPKWPLVCRTAGVAIDETPASTGSDDKGETWTTTAACGQTTASAPAPAAVEVPTPPPTPPPAATPATAAAEEPVVKATRPGTFEIHFHDSGIREAFQLLSSPGQKNIIATKEVTGKVTADLYGVTFKEALEAVVRASGFVYVEEGNFIYVMTADQLKKQQEDSRKFDVKSFQLAYLAASDGLHRAFYLYPTSLPAQLPQYFFGNILPDYALTGGVTEAVSLKSTWNAASRIARYPTYGLPGT